MSQKRMVGLSGAQEERFSKIRSILSDALEKSFVKNPEVLAERIWAFIENAEDDIGKIVFQTNIMNEINRLLKLPNIQEQNKGFNSLLIQIKQENTFQALIQDGQIVFQSIDLETLKPYCAALKVNDKGEKIVFGAAPEFIKTFLGQGEQIPQNVVLAKNTFKDGINFAEIEFAIYGNFFFQNKRKVTIVCTSEQEKRLRTIMQITLLGPDYDKMIEKNGKNPALIKQLLRLKQFRDTLAPRNENKSLCTLDDYINFVQFQDGRAQIKLNSGEMIQIDQDRTNDDGLFTVVSGTKTLGYIDLSRVEKKPVKTGVERNVLPHDELGMFILDSGNGFTPDKFSSSFIVWMEGCPVLFDPMPYSDEYLRLKGLPHESIKTVYLSHNHGDHDQGVYNYLIKGQRLRLIGAEIVVNSTIEKVAAATDIAVEEVEKLVEKVILPVGEEVKLPGFEHITIKLEYGWHPIPTTMCKLYYRKNGKIINTLGYSGDTIYDHERFRQLDPDTAAILRDFFQDVTSIIHEAGGKGIHTEMDKFAADHGGKDIYWVHTKEEAAKSGTIVHAGEHFTLIPEDESKKLERYVQLFDKVSLFSGLNSPEKLNLALKAEKCSGIEVINYEAGENIVREGEYPEENSFYIISRGTVDLYSGGSYIISLGEAQELGEMALFGNNDGRRCATARALSGVQLLKFSEEVFRQYLKKFEASYQKYVEVREAMNAPNSPFRDLALEVKEAMAVQMQREEFRDGDVIIRKNDTHHKKLYILTSGQAAVILDKSTGVRVRQGSVLGEMSLLESTSPTAANVIATGLEKTVVYSLDKEKFDILKEQYPVIYYTLDGIRKKRKTQNESLMQAGSGDYH